MWLKSKALLQLYSNLSSLESSLEKYEDLGANAMDRVNAENSLRCIRSLMTQTGIVPAGDDEVSKLDEHKAGLDVQKLRDKLALGKQHIQIYQEIYTSDGLIPLATESDKLELMAHGAADGSSWKENLASDGSWEELKKAAVPLRAVKKTVLAKQTQVTNKAHMCGSLFRLSVSTLVCKAFSVLGVLRCHFVGMGMLRH